MQSIHEEPLHLALAPFIPLANEHGARLVLDFVDHHSRAARVELHEITTPK
jgi:hypothetical protein